MKKIIATLLIILIFSCAGENTSTAKKESKLVGFFMGQVMREVKGKADPKSIQEALNKHINH